MNAGEASFRFPPRFFGVDSVQRATAIIAERLQRIRIGNI